MLKGERMKINHKEEEKPRGESEGEEDKIRK